jgi:hypothetical protein
MATNNFVALLFTLSLVFKGCTPVRVVSSNLKPGTTIKSYQTYNYMDISFKNEAFTELNSEGIQILKTAIDQQMQERGFTKTQNPDLWLNIGIVIEDKVQTRQTNIRDAPLYIGQRNYSWRSKEVEVNRYKLGTVTLDLVDQQKNEQIWEGVVQGTISNKSEKMKKRVNKGIDKLFNQLSTPDN